MSKTEICTRTAIAFLSILSTTLLALAVAADLFDYWDDSIIKVILYFAAACILIRTNVLFLSKSKVFDEETIKGDS